MIWAGSVGLTKYYIAQPQCEAPPQVLFPQMVNLVRRYAEEKVRVVEPADIKDLFLAPYYGWLVEILTEHIQPDALQGEAPEVPRYEASRGRDRQRRWIFGPAANRVR